MDYLIEAIKRVGAEIDRAVVEFDFFKQSGFEDIVNESIKRNLSEVESIKEIVRKRNHESLKLNENGKYIVTYIDMDSLDNNSKNWSFGSLFTVYEEELKKEAIKEVIYIIYGPRTELVITKDRPEVFLLDANREFKSKKYVTLNESGKVLSFGSVAYRDNSEYLSILESFFEDGYRLRHSHSIVMDINVIFLKKGGLLMLDNKQLDPIFDLFGFEYLFKRAGSKTIKQSIENPIFLGSKSEIEKIEKLIS